MMSFSKLHKIHLCVLTALMGVILIIPSTVSAAEAPDFAAAHKEVADLLSSLIRINTSNPPGDETKVAEFIKQVLAREGIQAEIFEKVPGRGSLVARLKGNGTKRPLLIMAHEDVVGVERDKWTVDPFAAIVKDGYIYGRGSSDDKGMLASNLEVFLLLHRLKVPLDRDVVFLAEAGEEGTSEIGMDFMVDDHWDKIACEYALNEGGRTLVKDGVIRDVDVSTTEKVPRRLKVIAHGTSGHGSMPRMDNPVVHLAAAVAKIGAWQSPMRLNETTKAYFEQLAKISPPEEARLYSHLSDPAVQQKLRESNIFLNSMLRTSISPTIIKGGFRENVIPAEAEATLDVRALPDEDMDKFIKTLTQLIDDPRVEVIPDYHDMRPAPPPSSIHTEMFEALQRAQQQVFPSAATLPLMVTGATDSAQLRAKGVQAYGLLFPVGEDDLPRMHGNDERASIKALGQFVEFLYVAVTDVAGAK
jgi:acetylornithine deacetylase/succinyl-diaminopimelate desuccinylase-like protein